MRNTFVEDKMTEFIEASLDFFESAEGVEWMRKTLVETITTARREALREVREIVESRRDYTDIGGEYFEGLKKGNNQAIDDILALLTSTNP